MYVSNEVYYLKINYSVIEITYVSVLIENDMEQITNIIKKKNNKFPNQPNEIYHP